MCNDCATLEDVIDTGISLQTRMRSNIRNTQSWNIDHLKYAASLIRKRFNNAIIRSTATGVYNCHGLTFGSKRCEIGRSDDLKTILIDDSYKEIQPIDALPGDVIMYFANDGDYEHSGILVSKVGMEEIKLLSLSSYDLNPVKIIFKGSVVSKWGPGGDEMLHEINECPYAVDNIKFFRMIDCAIAT